MRALLILLLVLIGSVTSQKKCCDHESYLKKTNSIYVCDKDEDKRLQIFTETTDYLKQIDATSEDTCLDVNETDQTIIEYRIKNQSIAEGSSVDVNYYPKCCPLNFFYNSLTHSCVWKDNMDQSFIKQKFIKVGLPNCRVIADYKLGSGTSGSYRIELDTLYIGNSTSFPEGKYCVDRDEDDLLIARGCYEDLSVCSTVKCVHKCCPDGQSFINGSFCRNTYKHGLNLNFTNAINNSKDPFAIVHGYNCRVYVLKQQRIPFYLDPYGVFWVYYNSTLTFMPFAIEESSYCIEHAQKKTPKKYYDNFEFFMCFLDEEMGAKFYLERWAKIVSCVFILMTIGVYIFLPEMLNLFGKILFSYCFSTLVAFILLTYSQFVMDLSDETCVKISFSSLYASLCSFSWLNVMCFDIWWTFGTPKSLLTAKQRKDELRRFILYSLYGWGCPAFVTTLTYLAYITTKTPYPIKPLLGLYKCFWERRPGNYSMFLFYVTPLIFMEIENVILFIKTVRYCLKVKREINRMNDGRFASKDKKRTFQADKEQLFLIMKLSVIMGISFGFEVVSSFTSFKANPVTMYIEIVWDTFNCLQGLFIFLIFICKVKVYRLCRTKIRGVKTRKISLSSFQTGTSQVSTPLTSGFKVRNL